jgi:hypothetical protein
MFQTYYDKRNNRFIQAPLSFGSSYTNEIAGNLGWTKLEELYHGLRDNDYAVFANQQNSFDNSVPSDSKHITDLIRNSMSSQTDPELQLHGYTMNISLRDLYVFSQPKYADAEIISIVRDPWNRYLTASEMILGTRYDAPLHITQEELTFVENRGEHPGWSDINNNYTNYAEVDRKIEQVNKNKINGFDFTLNDSHLVPCLSIQLAFYAMFDKCELVVLGDYTDWLIEHYPAEVGTSIQAGNGRHRRSNSDTPRLSSQNSYKRFLSTNPYYDEKSAERFGILHTFQDFISYEYDAWDLITNKQLLSKRNAAKLLMTLMDDPYFFYRTQEHYQFFVGGAHHGLIDRKTWNPKIVEASAKIISEMAQQSWLNLSNDFFSK